MRLLHTDISKGFILKHFNLEDAPRYAILSHRWGDDEVSLRDLTSDGPKDDARFAKIIGCCMWGRKYYLNWIWIDTCCINQDSSAELSESINSMFLWYTKATLCFVHLKDVSSKQDPEASGSAFQRSEWFRRGWTLQELIAPRNLVFFTQEWDLIGYKRELAGTIQEITKIHYGALCNHIDLEDFSVAEKMSWASNRETTKVEDRAYSLLGIFGVNMTTIYGEGQKAFQRLQYAIISQSNDYSIFAWDVYDADFFFQGNGFLLTCGLLAPSPDSFINSAGIISPPFLQFAKQWGYQKPVADIQRTNTGIRLEVPIFEPSSSTRFTRRDICIMAIACKKREHPLSERYQTIGIVLRLENDGYYSRVARMDFQDADRLTNSGGQWKIETIDVGIKERRGQINNDTSNMLKHIPKSYEVVVKAHTLNALKGFQFRLWSYKSHCFVEKSPGQHTWERVEDPQTRETDFIVEIQHKPDSSPAQHEDSIYSLYFSWKWGKMTIALHIWMKNDDFVVCDKICLKNDEGFNTGLITSNSASKTNRYWSVEIPNKGSVCIHIILMHITTELVRYGLDIVIRPSRPNTSSIGTLQDDVVSVLGDRSRGSEDDDIDTEGTKEADMGSSGSLSMKKISRPTKKLPRLDSSVANPSAPVGANIVVEVDDTEAEDETPEAVSQPDDIGQDSKSKQDHKESPVQWVPACLGAVPEGAYTVWHSSYMKLHVVRAHHNGIIKLGLLTSKWPWATLITSADRRLDHICEYEVLVGKFDQLDWVRVQGPFTLDALGGAKPVYVTGGDGDESSLYVARDHDRRAYGMVRIGSYARFMRNNDRFNHMYEDYEYEVLVYKQ